MYDPIAVNKLKETAINLAKKKAKGRNAYTFLPKPFYRELARVSGIEDTMLNINLPHLFKEGVLKGKYRTNPFGFSGKITVTIPDDEQSVHEKNWKEILQEQNLDDDERSAIISLGKKLEGFNKKQQKEILASLINLRSEQHYHKGKTAYDISAKYFLGSSKFLDNIKVEARKFGIETQLFQPQYRYVCVAGNKNTKAVILVENPHAFETAVKADVDLQCTWISSYGFGIALDKRYRHGEMLVSNICDHKNDLIQLIRAGSPDTIQNVLSHENIFFWGDFDIAGLQIYLTLKNTYPDIKLCGLYDTMLNKVKSTGGHPYVKIVGKNGQKSFNNTDDDIALYLKNCVDVGYDQEGIDQEEIVAYIEAL